MLNDGETVQCQISDAAMDELAGLKGTESTARQAQFLSLRDTIERIASDLFDEAPTIQGYVIRIFTKHLRREPPGWGEVPNRNEHQPHAKRPRRASRASQTT